HQAAGRGVEGVAAVHRAAIVPPHEIADLPFLCPGELVLDHVSPELIEQRLARRDRQPDHIGIDAAAETERFLAGFGMGADHRLARARHLGDILDLLEPLLRTPPNSMSLCYNPPQVVTLTHFTLTYLLSL